MPHDDQPGRAETGRAATASGAPPGDAAETFVAQPEHEAVAAFFDVDNTLVRGASAFHLGRELFRRGFFRWRDLVTFGWHQARYLVLGENADQIDSIQDRALSIMRGHRVAEVVAIGEEVYDEVLAHRIFPGTRALLDEHLAAGDEVWLVTATPVEVATLIARRLGATGALGTVAEHEGGRYTGRLVGSMMHDRAKADAVRALAAERGLDLSRSYAYGDSTNDLPMLEIVGHPCAINPERRLRRHAAAVGWPTRDFRGSTLSRLPVRQASIVGAAWTATIALRALTRWWRHRLAGR